MLLFQISEKVKKTLADLGLVSDTDQSASDSSECSDSEFLKQFEPSAIRRKHKKQKESSTSSSSSDSSDESDFSSKHNSQKKKHSKKSKKSGMSKKASDKVKYPHIWPHSVLQFQLVSQNVQFKDFNFNMFVAGECEVLRQQIFPERFLKAGYGFWKR